MWTMGPNVVMKSELCAAIVYLLSYCFHGETLVHTNTGLTTISELSQGDVVRTVNVFESELLRANIRQVTVTFSDALVGIEVGGEVIWSTQEHPFLVDNMIWIEAKNLTTKNKLRTFDNGAVPIDRITEIALGLPVQVFNVSVSETHVFLVGEAGFIVHNK